MAIFLLSSVIVVNIFLDYEPNAGHQRQVIGQNLNPCYQFELKHRRSVSEAVSEQPTANLKCEKQAVLAPPPLN